jgi:hypothetical protein
MTVQHLFYKYFFTFVQQQLHLSQKCKQLQHGLHLHWLLGHKPLERIPRSHLECHFSKGHGTIANSAVPAKPGPIQYIGLPFKGAFTLGNSCRRKMQANATFAALALAPWG